MRRAALLLCHGKELARRQHRDAERTRLVELAARLVAADKIVGLTNDRRGEIILRFLTDSSAKSALDGLLMNGLRKDNSGWGLEHDAFDKRGDPVLFGYSCDLPRINRYVGALEKRGLTGTLICFDFQMSALKRLCGDRVVFQSLDPDAVEEAIFDQQETTD